MFAQMLEGVREEVTDYVFRIRIDTEAEAQLEDTYKAEECKHEDFGGYAGHQAQVEAGIEGSKSGPRKPIKRDQPKVGRNDPCPCGSGKKYKKCCGLA